jgi:ABC-type polysaccharide/polyol phosphate transport system ATPase subunit
MGAGLVTAQISQPLLQVTGLVQRFERTLALDDIDFCVAPLEVVGVVGPNGSGKSTLLNVIAGQLRPTAGRCGSPEPILPIVRPINEPASVLRAAPRSLSHRSV